MNTEQIQYPSGRSLYWKIAGTFVIILIFVGLTYIGITAYFANQFFAETHQKLHANLANHLIEEKFKDANPFLEDGSINKPLFGDIMHDMMAVNRRIEVYLLDTLGYVKYSVVLDHDAPNADQIQVDLDPIDRFIQNPGENYILGDDPTSPGTKKAFSASRFDIQNQSGYIYIILDSDIYDTVSQSILGTYIGRLGISSGIFTLFFAIGIGLLIIWYLTRNLRRIIRTVNEFEQGNLHARIDLPSRGELSTLAESFNRMANTILANIESIENSERIRKELIANVSHDLRNPLAIIHGYIETLQIKGDKLTEGERNSYIKIILKSLERLKKLVGELFELSRLESQGIQLKQERINVRELIFDISEKYQVMAAERDICFRIGDFEQERHWVWADLALIERVLHNLLDNALKFTPHGGEIILELDQKSEEIEIRISDTGVGIAEEDIPHLFERYYTKSRSQENKESGTGLGLAIVKRILELHDRTIQVMSKPNMGTTFSFSLPVR